MEQTSVRTARREFLKFLAASPYVAALGGVTAFLERNERDGLLGIRGADL